MYPPRSTSADWNDGGTVLGSLTGSPESASFARLFNATTPVVPPRPSSLSAQGQRGRLERPEMTRSQQIVADSTQTVETAKVMSRLDLFNEKLDQVCAFSRVCAIPSRFNALVQAHTQLLYVRLMYAGRRRGGICNPSLLQERHVEIDRFPGQHPIKKAFGVPPHFL